MAGRSDLYGKVMQMDWRLFVGTFALIFLAELGDKTQLAALSLVKNPADRWIVFAGAAAALVVSTFIAVMIGGWLSRHIPPFWFKIAAGVLFLSFGALTLREAFAGRPGKGEATQIVAPPEETQRDPE